MYDLPHSEACLYVVSNVCQEKKWCSWANSWSLEIEERVERKLTEDSPCVVTNMRDVRRGECGQRDERACAANQVQSSVAQECTSGVEPAERNWRGNVLVSVSWDRLSTRLRDALLAWRRGARGGGEDSPNEYIRRTSRSPKEHQQTDQQAHILSTFGQRHDVISQSFEPKKKKKRKVFHFFLSINFFLHTYTYVYTSLFFVLLCIFTWVCPRHERDDRSAGLR